MLKLKMRLSRQAIEEFKEIYYQEFGEKISEQEVQEMGEELLFLFETFYVLLPVKQLKN
jgi:hypothetical protein